MKDAAPQDIDALIQEYAEVGPEYTVIKTFTDDLDEKISDIFVVSATEDDSLVEVTDIIVLADPPEVSSITFTEDDLTDLAVFWLARKGYTLTEPPE